MKRPRNRLRGRQRWWGGTAVVVYAAAWYSTSWEWRRQHSPRQPQNKLKKFAWIQSAVSFSQRQTTEKFLSAADRHLTRAKDDAAAAAFLQNQPTTPSYFFLHVGPAKTASTTLQHGLAAWNQTLAEQDHLIYHFLEQGDATPWNFLTSAGCRQIVKQTYQQILWHKSSSSTTTNNTRHTSQSTGRALLQIPCLKPLTRYIHETRRRHAHDPHHNPQVPPPSLSWLYSNEDLSTGLKHDPWDYAALQAALQGVRIRLVVVVTYRRYTDWLFSTHQHVGRWTGRKPAWAVWPGTLPNKESWEGRVLPFVQTALQYGGNQSTRLLWNHQYQQDEMQQKAEAILGRRRNNQNSNHTSIPITGQHKAFPFYYMDQILHQIPQTVPVRIWDLHAQPDQPVTHFVCHVLGRNIASHTCQEAQRVSSSSLSAAASLPTTNMSSSSRLNTAAVHSSINGPTLTQYDHLVVAAYEVGRIPNTTDRRQAGLHARQWHQSVLGGGTDWPSWDCPTPPVVSALRQVAHQRQAAIWADPRSRPWMAASGHKDKEDDALMENNVKNHHWCLVNAAAILANATWDPIFTLLSLSPEDLPQLADVTPPPPPQAQVRAAHQDQRRRRRRQRQMNQRAFIGEKKQQEQQQQPRQQWSEWMLP